MEADAIFATGGAGGITGMILFILYKLLNKRIRSKCCGNTIEIGDSTPKKRFDREPTAEDLNYTEKCELPIENEKSRPTYSHSRDAPRPSGSSSSENQGRETSQATEAEEGKCSSSGNFTRENPIHIVIPKPL